MTSQVNLMGFFVSSGQLVVNLQNLSAVIASLHECGGNNGSNAHKDVTQMVTTGFTKQKETTYVTTCTFREGKKYKLILCVCSSKWCQSSLTAL